MKNEDIINTKLEELIELSAAKKDNNTMIVLLALLGTRREGQTHILAAEVQNCVKKILLPRLEAEIEINKANLN